MTRVHYTVSARSQGKLYMQRQQARLTEKDIHRWLSQHLDSFYCDLPHVIGPVLARTHIVLNNTPPLHAMARTDEAITVNARGMTPRDAVKALIKATGLNPHMSVCGWPFCLDDVEGVDDMEGGAA